MKGYDNEMNPRMSPSMDSRNKRASEIKFRFWYKFDCHHITLQNHRLALELNVPIFQRYKVSR